ncbi:MAG: hypothetical protein ABDH59_07870 [Fervidobacterium sp.]
MTNYWLKYQAISGRIWANSCYYQVSAGYGFRDRLLRFPDFFCTKPETAWRKKQILLHAAHQFQKATCYIGGLPFAAVEESLFR